MRSAAILLACALVLSAPAPAQSPIALPAFDAATIRPPDPAAHMRRGGFNGDPGGRVFFGGTIKMLVQSAFNLQEYQVVGGPNWAASQQFDINAVPPENSPSRNIKGRNAEPAPDQRLMLQSLLRDRFGFKYHIETKTGDIYMLTRGTKPLALNLPEDPTSDPRAIVYIRQGGIMDGEAMGSNTSTDYLAIRLSRYLELPVVNQTGITGSYDFHLPPNHPGNEDIVSAVTGVVNRLGLKLKRGRGPIQTLVIDHVEQPTGN